MLQGVGLRTLADWAERGSIETRKGERGGGPEVWAAVFELAYVLHEGLECLEWPKEPGTGTYALPGPTIRAIVRRASVAGLG